MADIVPKILGLLVMPVMTAYLSPAEYGVYYYVNSIVIFLSIFGLLSVNTYYLVFYYRQPSDQDRRRLLGSLTTFVMAVNVVITVLLLLFGGVLFGQSEVSFFPNIALGVGIYFFQLFSVLPTALYRLRERPMFLSMLVVARSVLQVGLGLVAVVQLGYGVSGMLWAQLLVTALFGVIFLKVTFKNAVMCWDMGIVKRALKFSLPLLPGAVAFYLITMSDRVLIERYLTLSDLGLYNTAANLALMLNLVSYGAYKAFEPYFYKNFESEGFGELFARTRNGFLFVMLVGVLCVGLYSREFFELFTSEMYHGAYYYVPMILIGVLASAMMTFYGTVVTARGLTKVSSAITIVGGGVSVGLNIWLLPLVGLPAAAMTSGVAFSIMLAGAIYYSKMRTENWRPLICVVVTAVVMIFGVYVMPRGGFWQDVMVKGLLVLISGVGMLLVLQIRYKKLIMIIRR